MPMILAVVFSYLIGSIPTGYLMGKWIGGIDIRKCGSGNVGATNVFRTLGKGWGAIVLAIDIFKGFAVSYWVAPLSYSEEYGMSKVVFQLLAGCIAISGHAWPIWLKFRGGKGVATSCGTFLGIYPIAVSASLGIWIALTLLFKYVSLSSLIAAFTFPLWLIVFYSQTESFAVSITLSILLFLLIVFTHRTNIKRMLSGTELKIGKKKSENNI